MAGIVCFLLKIHPCRRLVRRLLLLFLGRDGGCAIALLRTVTAEPGMTAAVNQGVGEGFHATFFALLALGLRVIFAYALHNTALFGYTAVWWSQAMAWTVTLLVCYAHVFRGKWKNKSLI